MTRANLNFTYNNTKGVTRTLYHYHNGDQYPTGIRQHYNVLDLLKDFTPDGFKAWLEKNYADDFDGVVSITERDHPIIGDLTDYTYVFNSNYGAKFLTPSVQVYNWDKQIFTGDLKEFEKWIKEQE